MTISTKGRKIQIKQGLNKDFTNDTLDVGEFGLILDKDEWRIGLADGTTMLVNGGTAAESQLNSHKELIATNTTLGHVKVGTNIDITSGAISVANASIGAKGVVQLNDTLTSTSTTLALTARQGKELKDLIDNISVSSGGGITIADIPDASTTSRGLMTITQVNKLNGISSGANLIGSVLLNEKINKPVVTVFADDNKKYLTTDLSKDIELHEKFISNKIKLIGYEVV